ncbi:Os05g0492100 [Oryza sativa Japonica Group]|uniref:Os05g0492100 protein n=2 Tax=Oryza sativa subsp. japonica TaxID=39947 RepID=Q0DH45_ORYSJ|nr:unknown protein [Oryza sativa Japonica Group]KAB8099995.1 hypothetical protein EE612_030340 [Oryza sativa]BAF17828.1 Os05g0492100 [Oryza sativa Japonica Group]BAS94672.1 Os05g0492100 [Oryza sativa Japonica Group]|eukprot:NP_001055914.1 Os05g0492100 [Oryza sativa Japonica Group]
MGRTETLAWLELFGVNSIFTMFSLSSSLPNTLEPSISELVFGLSLISSLSMVLLISGPISCLSFTSLSIFSSIFLICCTILWLEKQLFNQRQQKLLLTLLRWRLRDEPSSSDWRVSAAYSSSKSSISYATSLSLASQLRAALSLSCRASASSTCA